MGRTLLQTTLPSLGLRGQKTIVDALAAGDADCAGFAVPPVAAVGFEELPDVVAAGLFVDAGWEHAATTSAPKLAVK